MTNDPMSLQALHPREYRTSSRTHALVIWVRRGMAATTRRGVAGLCKPRHSIDSPDLSAILRCLGRPMESQLVPRLMPATSATNANGGDGFSSVLVTRNAISGK